MSGQPECKVAKNLIAGLPTNGTTTGLAFDLLFARTAVVSARGQYWRSAADTRANFADFLSSLLKTEQAA